MIEFPIVPAWWKKGYKLMKLNKPFIPPDHIIGYDTETCQGKIMTQQFYSDKREDIIWVNDNNILDNFLNYISENYKGFSVLYLFNAQFDLAILLRKFLMEFMKDTFKIEYRGWSISVLAATNWFAYFTNGSSYLKIVDIHSYFSGSLDKVSKSFRLDTKKLKSPEGLGEKIFTPKDQSFIDYAMTDAKLCYEMGRIIVDIHKEFDIPLSTSSANMAEKVFRRNFIDDKQQYSYPPDEAARFAELTYHGGKNSYKYDNPVYIEGIYEYDFVSAYGYAMYSLPSFISGRYKKVYQFDKDYVGHYLVRGTLKPCPYGIFYDTQFQYFKSEETLEIKAYVTSYELQEAIRAKEFNIKSCEGWIWIPETDENPLRNYAQTFWEKKNTTKKGDVNYIFYKLLLNSLYGKWIQRNQKEMEFKYYKNNEIQRINYKRDLASGLYQPFIASLITGHCRARLHQNEHILEAIECSTDSIKTTKYIPELKVDVFGRMKLERLYCKLCEKDYSKSNVLFVRNRLNLLMDKHEHVMKAALHGFWGTTDQLKELWKNKNTYYLVDRMPLVRESLRHVGKAPFMTMTERRHLNIEWAKYQELRK